MITFVLPARSESRYDGCTVEAMGLKAARETKTMARFSLEDLRALAAVERQMDDGAVPWVRVDGVSGRASVSPRVMELLGLRSGQSVSWTLWGEILRLHLEHVQADLAAEVAANTVRLEEEVSRG